MFGRDSDEEDVADTQGGEKAGKRGRGQEEEEEEDNEFDFIVDDDGQPIRRRKKDGTYIEP